MKININRIKNYCGYAFCGAIKEHQLRIIINCAIIIAAIIIGIIACNDTVIVSNNYILIMRNEKQFNIFALFFKMTLLFCLCYLSPLLGVFNRYLRCVSYIILFFVAYKLGMNISNCVREDKALSIIYIIIYYAPVYITFFVCLTISQCICAGSTASKHNSSPICRNNFKKLLIKIGYICAVTACINIILLIIIPCIAKAIVVV